MPKETPHFGSPYPTYLPVGLKSIKSWTAGLYRCHEARDTCPVGLLVRWLRHLGSVWDEVCQFHLGGFSYSCFVPYLLMDIYIYMWHIVTHMIYVLFMCRSYVSYFWVNYNDLTVLPHYNHSRGNDPQMAELFRLVKYSNWPRYFFWWSPVDHFIFWMDSTKPSSSRWTRGQLQPGTAQDHVQAIMERLLKSVDGDIWHILSTIIIYIYIYI